jgi:tetratricopeptide (TPR) repeat protein
VILSSALSLLCSVRRSASLLFALVSLASALPAQLPSDSFVLAKEAFLANDLASASSLFEAAVRSRPEDAERRAWRAEAARRLQAPVIALREAREALRLDPCNSIAHEVVAGLYNPQFAHMALQSDDSTSAHLEAAVRCDATNGSAWMSLWVQSLRAGDAGVERRALEGLSRSGIVSASWLAHGRWVLRTLPPDALVIAAGDIDTYPVAIAQGVDALRPDVALVNRSMLNIAYVVRHLVRRYHLPLPSDLSRDSSRDGSSDSVEFQSDRIIAYWRAEAAAGRLGRPLVILHSMGIEYAEAGAGALHLSGPHWTVGGDGPAIDSAAVARAYALADATDFSGPVIGANDRSPVRVSSAFSPALMLGYLAAYEAAARGGVQSARVKWLEAALQRAGVPDASAAPMMQWIRSFPAK